MTMVSEQPRPDRFYKYASAAGTVAMLRNLNVWWKSPPLFNDPFDTQLRLNLGCTAEQIVAAAAPVVEALIYSSEPLDPGMDERIRRAVLLERSRATPELRPTVAAGVAVGLRTQLPTIQRSLDDGQAQWTSFLDSMRVLSVSEINDDILMWSHYADCHKGAVLELRPLPGVEAWDAKPIRYATDIPVMASAEQWVRHVFGLSPINFEAFFEAFAFTKSAHWAYEREWRCRITDADPARDVPGQPLIWACPLRPDQVTGVYLGCRMSDADRTDLRDAVRARAPNARMYEAVKSPSRFSLDFRPGS